MKNHQKNIPPQTIHGLFEAQVRKTPDAVALVYRDTFVTYEDLNRRANHVARRLRDHGVGKDYLVGLYLDRSIELLVGLLGILKAGGAYVPLDPVYPEERVDFILRDSGLNLVVTCQNLQHQIEGNGVNLVLADEPEYEQNNDTESDLEDVTGAEGLAYVIYTSGSTGQPKGVMVTHRNVVRLFQSTAEWFGFDSEDVWTMFHSYAFDFSVWEMWGALFHGGRLVIVPQEIARSPEEFHRLVEKEKITVLCQIPYVFYQMMKIDEQIAEKSLASLRYIIFGGEALNFQQLRSWYARHDENQPRLINMYGITETTVHVTYRPLSRADTEDSIGSMIGKPIPDLMVYIMDENLKPVPEGEVGELFVGGEGLARGYLDRPDLDRQRFIQNAFSVTEERLYRTGDLVRLLPDGDMEYIGRQDDQVKIRGFRIEPGEVEAVLESYPGIQEAAVVAQEIRQEEKQLVAFFTTKGKNAPEASELRQFLMDRLPLHMVPSRFILLEELPVTPSGKVDRRALKVDPFQVAQVREYTAPRTTVEETLARFWSEMLCVSRVSIHDNFFELGGHSLLVLRFIARVRDAFGINLPLRLIFDQPVLEEIASWIEKADHGVGGVEF
jgi:amino acid adenylation domain-containing protein